MASPPRSRMLGILSTILFFLSFSFGQARAEVIEGFEAQIGTPLDEWAIANVWDIWGAPQVSFITSTGGDELPTEGTSLLTLKLHPMDDEGEAEIGIYTFFPVREGAAVLIDFGFSQPDPQESGITDVEITGILVDENFELLSGELFDFGHWSSADGDITIHTEGAFMPLAGFLFFEIHVGYEGGPISNGDELYVDNLRMEGGTTPVPVPPALLLLLGPCAILFKGKRTAL